MKAVKCPICKGRGKITKPTPKWEGTITDEEICEQCYGCNGKGWVEVHEETTPKKTGFEIGPGITYTPSRPIYPGCVYHYPATITFTPNTIT